MTQRSRFWGGTTTGDATEAPYDAGTEFAQVMMSLCGAGAVPTNLSGVFNGELNILAVTGATSPVSIATGRAMVYGSWYENDASATLVIPTPAAATRIDRVVLRKDWAAQTVRITRVAGAEGGGAPVLTQVAGTTWDMPLAQASITTGGAITLTDQRAFLLQGELWLPAEGPVVSSTTANSSNTAFLIGAGVASRKVRVYVNGLIRRPTTDYTFAVSENHVDFVWAPVSGDDVRMEYVAA